MAERFYRESNLICDAREPYGDRVIAVVYDVNLAERVIDMLNNEPGEYSVRR